MITLKKIRLFFTALCICLLLVPMTVQATEVTSEFFTVDLLVGEQNNIAPGDTFSDTVEIENTAKHKIKVRVYDVDNVDDSKLYPVITAGWVKEGEEVTFVSFDDLTPTEWYTIESGKTLSLPLDMYFPAECGNEYQGATLAARFIIEARIPREEVGDIDSDIDDTNPKTGDQFNLQLWGMISTVSGGALLVLLLAGNKRRSKQA